MSGIDSIDVEYLLVCDAAQAVNGKLYILGGAWERIIVPQLPGRPQLPFFIAIGVTVPWSMTNQKFDFSLDLLDADGQELGQIVKAELEAGRAVGVPPGSMIRIPLTGPAQPDFPEAGRYVFRASIDGEPIRSVAIDVTTQAPR
jgi:hypothetical protein